MNDDLTTPTLSIDLIESASNEYAAAMLFYAAVAVLFYDTLLTFEDETTYIWQSAWSPIKCIFIIVRYVSLGIQIFSTFAANSTSFLVCSATKWVSGFGGLVLQVSADIFLVYRVYAFCGRNKRLLVFLIILLVATEAALFSLASIFLRRYEEAANPVPQLRYLLGSCIVLNDPRAISSIWIIILGFQSILFLCLLFEAISTLYGAWKVGIRHAPLYRVFIRDGLWAYFLLVVSLLLCVFSAYLAPQFGVSFITWFFTTTNICCCRLILNLRSVVHEDKQISLSSDRLSLMTM